MIFRRVLLFDNLDNHREFGIAVTPLCHDEGIREGLSDV